MRLRCDPARFAVDAVDGETVVMDLVDGRLVLLEAGAAIVWEHLTAGVPRDMLEAAVDARHGAAVRDDVRALVDDLVARGLLEDAGDGAAADGSGGASAVERSVGLPDEPLSGLPDRLPDELGPLTVTTYDDMTSIITMDPIHDVDPGRGWPTAAPA